MSLNKLITGSMGDPSRRVASTLKQQGRFIRELKTPQKVGADVMPIALSSLSTFGPVTITAGSHQAFAVTVVPTSPILTLWNFYWTLYVDTYDSGFAWPYGGALTGGQLLARASGRQDFFDFNRTTNQQLFIIYVENLDSSSHNYYIDMLAATPFV